MLRPTNRGSITLNEFLQLPGHWEAKSGDEAVPGVVGMQERRAAARNIIRMLKQISVALSLQGSWQRSLVRHRVDVAEIAGRVRMAGMAVCAPRAHYQLPPQACDRAGLVHRLFIAT
jgi:hypothetical protein